ncbi:MAG: nucleoside hydrolase, partial [Bacteroidia bacterium]|nr:nucleoside hydrolase [Bacteroidia bacterium]
MLLKPVLILTVIIVILGSNIMVMKRLAILLIALLLTLYGLAHPWKPRHYIIIDTDGGIDDIKAITMLLASPDVRVLAVSVSPGAINAQTGYIKVKSLLNGFYHEGIPAGINSSCKFKSPDFTQAMSAKWGNEESVSLTDPSESIKMLGEILAEEKNKITMVCLGGLSTAWSAISQIPQFRNSVKRIIWSADGLNDRKGFNYNIDPEAVSNVIKSGIPLTVVKGSSDLQFYNPYLTNRISEIHNAYSGMLSGY